MDLNDTLKKIDCISERLKKVYHVLERKRSILESYASTLDIALKEWEADMVKNCSVSDENIDNMSLLRRKFSITKLLMQRLAVNQVNFHSDVDLFEKFVSEITSDSINEFLSTIRLIDPDMQEISDPTLYGLSSNVPRSFVELLKWTPSDDSNDLDIILYGYLQNIK